MKHRVKGDRIDHNPEQIYISTVTSSIVIEENSGRIYENRGLIHDNAGSVANNRGTVNINHRVINGNYAKVIVNQENAEIFHNCGIVEQNFGRVENNFGIVAQNYGTVTLMGDPRYRTCSVIDNLEGTVNGGCGDVENSFGGSVSQGVTVHQQFYKVSVKVDGHLKEPIFDAGFDKKSGITGKNEMWLYSKAKGQITIQAEDGYVIDRVDGADEIEKCDPKRWVIKLKCPSKQVNLSCHSRAENDERLR